LFYLFIFYSFVYYELTRLNSKNITGRLPYQEREERKEWQKCPQVSTRMKIFVRISVADDEKGYHRY
jgi:hypothetical protein